MKQIFLVMLAAMLCMIGVVSAGSIGGLDGQDCTHSSNVCVHQTCVHYHPHGCTPGSPGCHCQTWVCDQYEEQCDTWIDSTTNDNNVDVDADTLNGQLGSDLVDEANDYTDDAVNDEASARQTADNSEASARQSADNTERSQRQAADNSERNARIGSDIALGIGIVIVDHTSRERDEDLQDNIDDETTNREAADADLQDNIDTADTNSQGRDTTINQYITDNQDKWGEDKVGSGMSRNALAHYLTGEWGMEWIFKKDMSFFEWLKGFFVQKDQYDSKIIELEGRIDKLESDIQKLQEATGTEESNDFEVAMVTSARTEEVVDVDGYKCDSNMDDCTKIIESPPSQRELDTAAEQAEIEALTQAQQDWQGELEWHTRICERLHIQWHCNAMNEMLAQVQ